MGAIEFGLLVVVLAGALLVVLRAPAFLGQARAVASATDALGAIVDAS